MTSTVTPAKLHHLALTVTNVDESVDWHEKVFGISFKMDVPHEGGVGKLLANEDMTLVLVLHRHDTNDGTLFSETVTGLDHPGFVVPKRADLEVWQDHLESNGVVRADAANKPLTQSPIADEPYGSVLVFRDPDNIQLELFSPAAAR
jgi:catechol 2,3-dioxygenase-like lactoylglutathione lyase family enzyme